MYEILKQYGTLSLGPINLQIFVYQLAIGWIKLQLLRDFLCIGFGGVVHQIKLIETASHVNADQVSAALLPIELPANKPGKAMEGDLRTWSLAIMGKTRVKFQVPGSSVPAPCVMAMWRVNQRIEDLFLTRFYHLSLAITHLYILLNSRIIERRS